jgi:hypothetical protein
MYIYILDLIVSTTSVIHVFEALWMEGVWSCADHIQAIHSQSPILRCTKLLEQFETKFSTNEFWVDENICFQEEGGWQFIPPNESICVGFWRFLENSLHSHRCFQGNLGGKVGNPMETFKIPHKSSHTPIKLNFISRLVMKRGLELMASTLGSTFWKEEVEFKPLSWHHLLHKSFWWNT